MEVKARGYTITFRELSPKALVGRSSSHKIVAIRVKLKSAERKGGAADLIK